MTQIDECLDSEQMAEKLQLNVNSFRNHYLPDVKAACGYYQRGRKILVDPRDFNQFCKRKFWVSPKGQQAH